MTTLCMDTSTKFLALGLIRDGVILGRYQKECWKQQSEEIFPCLIALMDECGIVTDDIDSIVISRGPGSYTGVRIAMTVAKVFAAMKELPLYTVSSLQLYAGMRENCLAVIDARGGRAYTGLYDRGVLQGEEKAENCADVRTDALYCMGDGHLVGREDVFPDLIGNFLELKDFWVKAENVHFVVPEYLKSSDSYLVKK